LSGANAADSRRISIIPHKPGFCQEKNTKNFAQKLSQIFVQNVKPE